MRAVLFIALSTTTHAARALDRVACGVSALAQLVDVGCGWLATRIERTGR